MESYENVLAKPKKLTDADLKKSFWLWQLTNEATLSYERLQAPGMLSAMGPAIKRLYGDDKLEYIEACQRHMEFYNTEAYYGGAIILGIVLSLEEEKANGLGVTGTDISAIRTSLMGPLAGMFDALRQGTAIPIVASITIAMALDGNFFAPVIYMIVTLLYVLGPAYWLFKLSYNKGKEGIGQLFAEGKLEKFMSMATTVGAITLGGLAATTVTLSSSAVWNIGSTVINVQEQIFDSVLSGILPLSVIALCFYLLNKKMSPTKIIGILIVVCVLLVLLNII